MAAKSDAIHLDRLEEMVQLPAGKAAMYIESCVWCMDQNEHQNGVELDLYFDNKTYKYSVFWPEDKIDIGKVNNFYNSDDALPYGAEAIAIFVCMNHTEFDALLRSVRRTGIDYWLGHKNANPNLPFQNTGRLEVSGILEENESNTISKRVKEKLSQTSQSDKSTLPVYVVVVAFDQPCAKMVLKNVNSE